MTGEKPNSARRYAAAAVGALGLLLAVAGVHLMPAHDLPVLAAFTLAFGVLSQTSVDLPSGAHFTSATLLLAAVAVTLGPAGACVVIPGNVLRYARWRDYSWRLVYTFGQMAVSVALAATVVQQLRDGLAGVPSPLTEALAALAFILVFDILNAAFAAGRLVLDGGGTWGSRFVALLTAERGLSQPLYYALTVVSALLWAADRWVGLVLITMLALFLHASLARGDEAARRYEEARTDTLTGLGNRRRLEDWVAGQLQGPFGLLFIDLDGLKAFNDGYGHAAGDAALIAVAQVLREQTRGTDLLVRYGGDEFLAILPAATPLEAEAAARRISAALGERSVVVGQATAVLRASVGSAACPEHGSTLMELLRHADSMMYGRKRRAAAVMH